MNKIEAVLCAAVLMALLTPSTASGASSGAAVAGPVPPAITSAKRLFVSNAGADSGLFPEPFSGDPNRTYDQFYAALQAKGGYELVSDPAQADLVLDIQLNAPYGSLHPAKIAGTADPLPWFRLVVYDRPSHYILWTITESVPVAYLQKTHDHNFDETLLKVAAKFIGLAHAGPPVY